ncbi:hypothetical protein ADUPG1_003013, partial [Aduncisulcus paluster]
MTLNLEENVKEAITIETTVLKAKGRKETEHTSPVAYWITPLLPVDTPVLIGKPAMRKLGITLNVRSMKLGENLRGRMKAIVYRMYGLADKSIKEINTKTEMGPYVDEFKKAKCEIKPVEKLKEAVEKGDKIAEKEWEKRIQRETRWNLTREVEEKTPLLACDVIRIKEIKDREAYFKKKDEERKTAEETQRKNERKMVKELRAALDAKNRIYPKTPSRKERATDARYRAVLNRKLEARKNLREGTETVEDKIVLEGRPFFEIQYPTDPKPG